MLWSWGIYGVCHDATYDNALLSIITPIVYSIGVIPTQYKSDLLKQTEKFLEIWK